MGKNVDTKAKSANTLFNHHTSKVCNQRGLKKLENSPIKRLLCVRFEFH